MHRSALNAEVQYHLKMQERERDLRQIREVEAKRASFLSRLVARLRNARFGSVARREPGPETSPLIGKLRQT